MKPPNLTVFISSDAKKAMRILELLEPSASLGENLRHRFKTASDLFSLDGDYSFAPGARYAGPTLKPTDRFLHFVMTIPTDDRKVKRIQEALCRRHRDILSVE